MSFPDSDQEQVLLRDLVQSNELSNWVSILDDSFQPSDEQPYVLLIRDLHGDYEAQMNVSKIMEVITHRSKSKPLILVEGASGPVDTSFFSSFPDQKVRKTVTKEYVSEGWITGPEYFSIIQPEKNARYEIWGVEDQNLYIRNFRTFREVRSNSEGVASWFVNIEDVIQQLKQKIYHPQLLEWDKKITDRMTGRMDLELYLNDLFQIINVEPYPNLNHFRLFLEKKKSFDFKRLDAEKNRFIQELSDLLSQDDLSQLIQKSLEYRLGKMQTVAYLEYLALQATKTDKDLLKEYPIFEDAIALFKMQNDTDISILIREIESCESQILNSLLKTEEEKRLYQLCEDVEMIKKISILQLTRKDWGKIQESIMGDPVGNLLRSVEELSKRWSIELSENLTRQSPVLKEHLEEAKSFYEIALNRDQVIAEKAIEQIKKKGVKEAVLVTGGFHTDGIKEIFIEKGIQCQVATPRLTHIPSDEVYLSRMLDERFESHALALPSLFSHLIKSISPLLQIREWERLATAYIQAWIADVFQRSGVQDNPNSREAVRRGLKSWASARMVENGRLNEDEEQIMGLVEKRLVQASPVKSLEMTREQIEQYIRTDPVQGEVVLRYLIKFYPDRKADIEFAKSLYRKLYQPRIFSIVDRKSAVRAVSLPKDYDERIDRSADALLPYTEIITAVNILLIHENTSNIKKIVFRLDADRDEVHIEEDVMFINLKNPEGLKTIDVLKIFQRDLGWDFVPAIHKIETRYPYLLFGGNDFEAFNVVLPERMAGMGDLVFAANAAQVLKEAFPGKVVRAVFGQEEDYRRTAEAKLIDGMDPDRNRQEINGVEVVLLDGNDGIIGRQDAAVIYALGGTEKEVFNQRGTFERFGGPAKAKVLVHEFGFESLIQDPLDSGEGHIGFFKDEIGMAPVSPFSRDLYSQKYPRDDEKILEQRKRILKKLPGWERLNQILGQQDLERTVASEWGFVYAHQGYSIKAYFETFEKAREKDEKFANGDKTFFVTCGQNDRDAQEQVAQWAENYDYNLLVYNSDTKTLTPVRESKGSRVTVILDYSVPRKLFSELFLYSDDLPTMVTGQDNLANILYLNILSSGRPFFFEQLIFQDVTSIYALIREKLGEEAVMRFRALWGHSPSEKAEASRMFSSPREYRKFFKKIALALNEHNSFVPQIYYLVLRMIAKRNVLEPGARAQVLVEELQREGQSGEVKRDGYVRKGDKSWEKFKKERRTIQEYDLTENYQENLVRLIEKMMQDPRLDPQVQARLKEHLEKIKDPDFKVYGFSSIVKDSEDYLLDYYDQAKNELYLGTDVMDELKERGPPSLVEEYLVHSILCPILGHDQAIMIQQVLFPDHYPDKKKLSEQTQEHLYKGVLGKAFRSLIDWRASSAGQKIVDVLFKRIHERYDLRDDVTLREVIMRLGDRYQLTKRPSWAESVRKSVFLEDKFNEAQNRQIDQWMRLTPDDVAHHQIRTAILSNLMLQQYIETSGKDEKGFERDFVLLSLGSLLQDVSKGVDPIKSLTEKGRFLSREERAVIHDHGRQSVLILDQTHAWEKMRVGGLIQNQEEEEILKMLVLYHADLPGFKKAQGQLPSELQDRVWLLLSFLKIADSVDAANDRSRPYNMHRPVRTLDALYAEEKESRYAGLQATQERMSGDERALEAFHQIVIHAGERLRKMEELAAETEIYHELYKRLRQQSAIREETPKTWAETHVPLIADKRIAEVTMEMALSDEMLKRLRDEGLSDRPCFGGKLKVAVRGV